LDDANIFLGYLGFELALAVALGVVPGAGETADAAALIALTAAAGSLGIAMVQASQPISVGENINGYLNTMEFYDEGNTPLNFVMYKSEYPEYVEYNGTDHAVYVPEPYVYVTPQ